MDAWAVYRCANPRCGLRFPAAVSEEPASCPRCHGPLQQQKRWPAPPRGARPREGAPTRRALVVENVRSAWNVGALLRIADAAGYGRVFLVGITPTPEHPQVAKTALGAQFTVRWSWHPNGVALLRTLRALGWTLWALETAATAAPLPVGQGPPPEPWAWVVGNEVTGLDPAVLGLCHQVWRLPMQGAKRSLNVATAWAAAVYRLATPAAPAKAARVARGARGPARSPSPP